MKVAELLITVVVFLIAAAASYLIGTILSVFNGVYGFFVGIIIFLFAIRHILVWHKVKSLLILPDFFLVVILAYVTYLFFSPYLGLWGAFAAVIVLLTGLAMIAYMREWEI